MMRYAIAATLAVALSMLAGCSAGTPEARLAARKQAALLVAKEAVTRGLREPESVRFQYLVAHPFYEGFKVCGQVSYEASPGNRVGPRPFISTVSKANLADRTRIALSDWDAKTTLATCDFYRAWSRDPDHRDRPQHAQDDKAVAEARQRYLLEAMAH